MRPKLVLVGRVAGAFGVRGEVRLSSYTAEPLALLRYGRLVREDGTPALTLTGGRLHKPGELVVRAEEVATREAAEALRGLRLHVPRTALPPPEDEDEFYLADLIGLRAVDAEGAPMGTVKAVHDFGAGDILEVDPGQGRPTALYPFTREVAPRIDLAAGLIVIVPPPEIEAGDETTSPEDS